MSYGGEKLSPETVFALSVAEPYVAVIFYLKEAEVLEVERIPCDVICDVWCWFTTTENICILG